MRSWTQKQSDLVAEGSYIPTYFLFVGKSMVLSANGLSTNNLVCLESKKVGEMRVELLAASSSCKVV
jgi:hypothetical protein